MHKVGLNLIYLPSDEYWKHPEVVFINCLRGVLNCVYEYGPDVCQVVLRNLQEMEKYKECYILQKTFIGLYNKIPDVSNENMNILVNKCVSDSGSDFFNTMQKLYDELEYEFSKLDNYNIKQILEYEKS